MSKRGASVIHCERSSQTGQLEIQYNRKDQVLLARLDVDPVLYPVDKRTNDLVQGRCIRRSTRDGPDQKVEASLTLYLDDEQYESREVSR
jgi:hypothetical protein